MPPKQSKKTKQKVSPKNVTQKHTPDSPDVFFRISPTNPDLQDPKITKADIHAIVDFFVYDYPEKVFDILQIKQKRKNIDDYATNILLDFIHHKTPRQFRKILVDNDYTDIYERHLRKKHLSDSDKELLLWILYDIIELLLHLTRDLRRKIITEKVIDPFMKRNDFITMLR